MGATPSSDADGLAESSATADDQRAPTDAEPVNILALPSDALFILAQHLPIRGMSSLACTCNALAALIPEDAWLDKELLLTRHLLDHIERPSDSRLPRLRVGRLRERLCVLCEQRQPVGVFPVTQLGVCAPCHKSNPHGADQWRYHQSGREAHAAARRDAALARLMETRLADALPLSLRGVTPRLLFSSEVAGGSLATMLRSARGARASLLVLVEKGDAHRVSARRFGAFCPAAWPRTPTERPPSSCESAGGGGGCSSGRSSNRSIRQLSRTSADASSGFFGDASAFLFALPPIYDTGGSPAIVYAATGRDERYVHVSPVHGVGFGGDVGLPGLGIDGELSNGTCLSSQTYGVTAELGPSAMTFEVASVQLWDLTPMSELEDAAGADADSVLSAHRADALLLPFIKIDRQVGGMRI